MCRPSGASHSISCYPGLTAWATLLTRLRRWRDSKLNSLEAQSRPKLDLSFREIGSKAQWLARGKACASMHVKWRSKIRAHSIVDRGIVGAVGDIESFGHELQAGLLAEFVPPAQTHVPGKVIWANPGIAGGSWWAVGEARTVAIHICSRIQIKGA